MITPVPRAPLEEPPDVIFFIALPMLLQTGMKFYPALLASCVIMSAGYGLFVLIKSRV